MPDRSRAVAGDRRARLRKAASLARLTVSVLLVGVKLVAWVLTGSVALLSSATDALVDTAGARIGPIA